MFKTTLTSLAAASALALAATAPLTTAAIAQERPADLESLPPVPTDYTPEMTSWGEYDFTGIWPIQRLNEGRILFQRPSQYGNRVWVTDEEFGRRVDAAQGNDGNYAAARETGIGTAGTSGLAQWFMDTDFAKRTSMLVSPADGQLPALTEEGERLNKEGRSGWVPAQHYDWLSDFDSWDRCVSRGFPASMYPFRYNNGIQVFQSPGTITIVLEMLGTRVIPIVDKADVNDHWPENIEAWMGNSRAYWDGKTLVIETRNITSGNAVTDDTYGRSASPLNMATQHVPPYNTIPMSDKARTTERITMTGPDTIIHELTYTDEDTYTAPWTSRIAWTRDEEYQFFEYACHEGNRMPRDYISASRAQRVRIDAGEEEAVTLENDDRSRFSGQFDWDPGVGPRPRPPTGAGG